jgi:Ca2+-binding RTX toxin-like protein
MPKARNCEGNRGDDLLVGGAYDDVLVGNFGDDVLVGGAGADQFRFFGNEIDGALDVDRIFDLNFAEGDRLVFGEFASGTFARSRDVTAFAGGSAAIVDSFSDLRSWTPPRIGSLSLGSTRPATLSSWKSRTARARCSAS